MNAFVKSASDLETSHEAKRAGFLEIALRKSREALPYIDEAKSLRLQAKAHKSTSDLLADTRIKLPLAEAAGISTKASVFLSPEDIDAIILEFIKIYLDPAGDKFADELTYRYLLAKGDALGGHMRNIIGAIANEKVTRYVTAQLRNLGVDYYAQIKGQPDWVLGTHTSPEMFTNFRGLKWENGKGRRELRYNLGNPIVKKNIDLTLFSNHTAGTKNIAALKDFF